jgi:hypothetical protein
MKKSINVSCNLHGVWIISAIIEGVSVTRSYYFSTRREAYSQFINEFKAYF